MLPAGPARDLRDAVYLLYAEADCPQLAELAQQIAGDDDLPGSPGKDLIGKIISGDGLGGRQDTVTIAVALARAAGRQDVASIAEQARRLWIAALTAEPASPMDRLGRAVCDCDPLVLEVHPAIQVPGTGTADGLPGYVPRAHDVRLRELVDGMLTYGRSRLVTLVGGSSTGKTRAGWELACYLDRKQPSRWRLWHPYDPTRPQAVLADLEKVGPDTIVWLNEAQHYLMPTDSSLGERIASGLRSLLADPGRGPVLVLATLWPDYWATLTTRPTGDGQARDLLALGTTIPLTDAFTTAELAGLTGPGVDAQLRYAAEHAEGGRITQYLAGAPALEDRYRTAPPAARAILRVAIDARRLGYPLALPHALLEQAGPGYLDDHDWDTLGDDWLESGLAYTTQPGKGARGPLTRIRIRPGEPALPGGQPCYRLADYLEQLGRTERAGVYPPDSLWQAFTTTSSTVLLRSLGQQAERRGRNQHAIWLYREAIDRGDAWAVGQLATLRKRAGDPDGAEALYRQAIDRNDIRGVEGLAKLREQAGDPEGAEALYQQAADRGNTWALRELAKLREQAGDPDGAEALYRQAVDRGDIRAVEGLASLRKRAGDPGGAEALYQQAADRGNTWALRELAKLREQAGDPEGAEALYRQAIDRGDTWALRELAELREQAGDPDGAEALYRQAIDRGHIGALEELVRLRERAGGQDGAEALAVQAATGLQRKLERVWEQIGEPDRGNTWALREQAKLREQAGDPEGAEALYRQAIDRGDTWALGELARLREQAGDPDGAEALYRQAIDHGHIRALEELARLREQAGDPDGADRIRKFGLTGAGEITAGLNFGS